MTPPAGIYLENDLLKAPAVIAIRSAHSFRVLLEFYRRRVIHKRKDHRGKRAGAVIMNNGELVLTFKEAKARLGISQATYSRCLSELVELGFLDIAELSSGLHRQATKWSISDRWRRYGQDDFQRVKRTPLTPPFVKKRKRQKTRKKKKSAIKYDN